MNPNEEGVNIVMVPFVLYFKTFYYEEFEHTERCIESDNPEYSSPNPRPSTCVAICPSIHDGLSPVFFF